MANLRRDFSGEITRPAGLEENGVLRLATEINVGDSAGGGITMDAKPVNAGICALP